MNQKQDMIDTEETMLPEPDAALLPYMEKLYPLTFALKQHKPWKTIYEYVRRPSARRHACLLSADRHGGRLYLAVCLFRRNGLEQHPQVLGNTGRTGQNTGKLPGTDDVPVLSPGRILLQG